MSIANQSRLRTKSASPTLKLLPERASNPSGAQVRGAEKAFGRQRQPWPDVPEARRAAMRANKGKHSKPELAVRRLLHALGYRFRLHRRDLPGTPDIVFPSRLKVIQAHGCFWHQHEGCRSATVPTTRRDYWLPKLARNRVRDQRAEAALRTLGWAVTTVWECEAADLARLAPRLRRFLGRPGTATNQQAQARSINFQ